MNKRVFVGLALSALIAAGGLAQSSQTGSVIGTVTATDGSTIPGVAVSAASSALIIGKVTTVTNENGVFRFANLPPGEYEITFQLEGFRTVIRKDFHVSVMQTFRLDISLKQEEIKEAIVVEGKGPTVDPQRVTRATNWDSEFLKAMPAARNLTAFVNMAPGMTGGSSSAQSSAHGGSTMDNSYNLDGVNLGDQATGTQGVMFGMDIMDEISVQSGGLTAEYGSVTGAMINVVTKSGGDKLSGSATMFYNGEKLMSDNTGGTPLEGRKITSDKVRLEPGFSVGGPVIKGKLWFFASGNLISRECYVTGYPYGAAEQLSFKTTDIFPYIKLTFQPNQQNRIILSYSGDRYKNDHAGASRYTPVETTQKYRSPADVVNLSFTHYFNTNFYANFKVGGLLNYALKWTSKDYAFDKAEHYDPLTVSYSGPSWRNKDWNQRPRFNANADATTFIDDLAGTHEVKFGAEYQYGPVKWEVLTAGNLGSTDSADQCGYFSDHYFGDSEPYSLGYRFNGNGFNRKDTVKDFAAFLQDTWRINGHLSLNLGLRYEYNSIIWPKQGEGIGKIASDITAQKWSNLSPRIGLIYDIFGDSRTLLKASFSRYIIPNQLGFVNNAHPNGWYADYALFYDGARISRWTTFWSPSTTRIGYKDYDLKSPYTDELTVGLERELFTDWSIGVRFFRKWDKRLIHQVDASQLDIDKLMATGKLDWTNWKAFTAVDPYDRTSKTFYAPIDAYKDANLYIVNAPGAKRDYKGLEITVNKRYANKWGLNISYCYNDSQGLINTDREAVDNEALGGSALFSDPNAHINNYGHLDLEERHQFKLQALWKGPLGINLSGYLRFLSGTRYTRIITASYIGLEFPDTNPAIYAEKRGASHLPDYTRLDLRIEKAFRLGGVTLAVFSDIFNVFNANTATSVWSNSSNTALYEYGETLGIMTPRIFQLGARIEFK